MPESTLTEIGEAAFRNSVARSIYSEAISLVEAHRAAGHKLVIVTAASRYQAQPVAKTLGIDEVCCTCLEVEEGKFNGNLIAPCVTARARPWQPVAWPDNTRATCNAAGSIPTPATICRCCAPSGTRLR